MTRSVVIVAAARLASIVLGVLLLGILARRLGPEPFGRLQLALAVMVYPALVADLGLTTLGLREIATGVRPAEVIRVIVAARVSLAVASSAVLAAAFLVLPLDGDTRVTYGILLLGIPAAALNARWVLQGEGRFGASAVVDVLTAAGQVAFVAVLVNGPADLVPAAIALTAATWISTVGSIVATGSWGAFAPRIGRSVAATIGRSLPLGAAAIAITIYYSIDTLLLGVFRSTAEVAWYAAAYRIILPILALAGAVGTVAIPRLSAIWAADPASIPGEVDALARRLLMVAAPIAVGGALVADPLIRLIYGPAFAPAVAPFRILIWSVLTVYANAAFAFVLLARRQDRRYLAATATGAIVNVLLNVIVIPIAGLIGAAAVTMVSELTVLGLIVRPTMDLAPAVLRRAIRVVAPAVLVMGLVIWPVRDLPVAIPLGAVVYGLGVGVTSGLAQRLPGRRRSPRIR